MASCETEFGEVSRAGDHPITHFEKWFSEMVSFAIGRGLVAPETPFSKDDRALSELFKLDFLAAEAAFYLYAPHRLSMPGSEGGKLWMN